MYQVNARTKLTGIFGYPVEHSLSPVLHNRVYEHMDLNWCYLPFQVPEADLRMAIEGIKALGLVGVNITMPHKEESVQYMDELEGFAEDVGSINTVNVIEGKLLGYNTDAYGFLSSLKKDAGFDPKEKKVVVIGAGGAAKAVSYALANEGAMKIAIVNRTKSRAIELAENLRAKYKKTEIKADGIDSVNESLVADANLIVNATSVGMNPKDKRLPISVEAIHSGQLVFDLIYSPLKTELLREAEAKGAGTLNGLGMLLYQGAAAFKIWTEIDPPIGFMKEVLEEAIASKGDLQ